MYLGELSGAGEWDGWGGPISQDAVNYRWYEIGQRGPAPIVPEELLGLYVVPTRGPRMFSKTPNKKGAFGMAKFKNGKQVNDFLNFWGKVAVDPYRKQSGISKVAGGILQVASAVVPVFGYMTAVAEVGNAAQAYGAQGGNENLAARVMAPSYAAVEAAETAKEKADFDKRVKALQALAPPQVAPPPPMTLVAPSTAQPVDLTKKPVATSGPKWTDTEMFLAALVGGTLLLGVARR
jgi:hypothetical protein